ncbi:MAG: transposase [Nitrososphaerota archaeon]|nr:transposase [Nitrososphaerota archaeon]
MLSAFRFAEYKGSKAGKPIVRVPAAYSTQECFFCGALNKVPLSVRQSECASCGRTLDRDVNAARIVLKRAIAQVGQDMPELKPVETGPLPPRTTGVANLVEEAGTTRHGTGAGSPRLQSWEDVTRKRWDNQGSAFFTMQVHFTINL